MNPDPNSLAAYAGLLNSLLNDIMLLHPSIVQKDKEYLLQRLAAEGIPFLTKTLPTLGKAILKGLQTGHFVCPDGFQRKGALPRNMRGLLVKVFNETGSLKSDADAQVLKDLLQVFFLLYKIEQEPTKKQIQKAVKQYLDVEDELAVSDGYLEHLSIGDQVLDEANAIAKELLAGFNPLAITPKHGPGAVATREKCEEKYFFKRLYRKIHEYFWYPVYFRGSKESTFQAAKWYNSLDIVDTGVSKLAFVPKDSRGPRAISMEPLEYQYIQGGLGKSLRDYIETHPLTRGSVNFTDQSVNQDLALKGSLGADYSTLDMKEASDRVSTILVKRVFGDTSLLPALLAARSDAVLLPDGRTIRPRKFAPMGSGLCFPVEALTFWLLAKATQKVKGLQGNVYVYGDDIISNRQTALALFERFPIYGLRFNEDKCFTGGPFRESCGCDAFKGENITTVKVRKRFPCRHTEGDLVASLFSLSRLFYLHGYWSASDYLENLALPFSKGVTYWPHGVSPSVTSAFIRFSLKFVRVTGAVKKWDKYYQRWNYKVKDYVAKRRSSYLKDHPEEKLLQILTGQDCDEYTVPHSVYPTMRWIFPHSREEVV